uniref:Uncharacterized protein n=1 Tax=Arundo donax TaxID=35708 RepID=A0A0A9BH29_ARUDO
MATGRGRGKGRGRAPVTWEGSFDPAAYVVSPY